MNDEERKGYEREIERLSASRSQEVCGTSERTAESVEKKLKMREVAR